MLLKVQILKYQIFNSCITALYILFIYILIKRNGIIEINEAAKYINAAQTGSLANILKDNLFYSGYIFFLSVLLPIGGVKLVVLIQVFLNITASIFLKKTLNLFVSNRKIGILIQIIFLFCYPIQIWTITLFNDSFFVSLISIFLFYTFKPNKTRSDLALFVILGMSMLITRPQAIMFIFPSVLYYVNSLDFLKRYTFLLLTVIGLISIFLFIFIIKVEVKGYIKPIVAGAIIVEKADYNVPAFNKLEKSSLKDAYSFILKTEGAPYLLNLFAKKIISFFTLTRPYYSFTHNLILCFYYLLYPLTLMGLYLMYRSNRKAETFVSLFIIALCSILTGLTYNEWHYRFTIELFPLLIISSSYSIANVIQKKTQ